MTNSHEDISDELLARYLAGVTSEEEGTAVQAWLNMAPENAQELEAFQVLWEKSAALKTKRADVDVDSAWNKVRKQIDVKTRNVTEETERYNTETIIRKLPVKKKAHFSLWIAAAISLTLVTLGWIVLKPVFSNPEILEVATRNNTMEMTLPDGTEVFLNYNSKISYPENFKGDLRSVALQGEAFFDVTPDAKHPFVIDAQGAEVRVLGTSFNVKAYKKELVRVDVKTGKVRLSKADKKIELLKGESAEMLNDTLKSMQANLNIMGYRTQIFDFNGAALEDIVNTLKEGYHTDIRLSNHNLAKCRLTIGFQKERLDTTLSVIAETLGLHLRKEGTTYWLDGNSCQ